MRPLPRLRGATLAATALIALAARAQTVDDKPQVKSDVLDRVTALLSKQAYVPGLDFGKWKQFAEDQKKSIDGSKNDEEFGMAVNQAFSKFGASHIALLTPRSTDLRATGVVVGVGITSQRTDDGTTVIRTVKGAPADKAGIVPGDTILKVDGKKVEGTKGIVGPEGTTVTLTVRHRDGKESDYPLVRTKYNSNRPEELIEISPDTARLAVYTFDKSYDPANVETLMKRAARYKNLIVDLRDNGGGRVLYVQHLLGLLMPRTDFGTFVDRSMVRDYVEGTGGKDTEVVKIAEWSRSEDRWRGRQMKPLRNREVPAYGGRVAVLVNRFSGSGAEIAAAALHDVVGAPIVGTKSAGAVLVSYIDDLSYGFSLEYPVMDYVTVRGLRLEGNGVTPTVKVEEPKLRLVTDPDPVVERAAAVLEKPGLSVLKP